MERKLHRSSLYARVLIVAIVLLFGILTLSFFTQRRAAESIESVHRAHVVLGELYELHTLLNMVETEQRGYIVTGDEDYKASYEALKPVVSGQLERLRDLTKGNAEQQTQVAELAMMTTAKMLDLDRAVVTRAQRGFNAAQAIEREEWGKAFMKGIRGQVKQMIAEGKEALEQRRQTLSSSFARTNWALASGGAVAILIGCVGAFLLWLALRSAQREERLERQKLRAERADRQKSRFLANMSHEIRTPMNAILGFGELLDGIVDDPKAQSYVAAIRRSGETLLSLINDILDLSKVEAGRLELHPEPADVRELAATMRVFFAEQAASKGLRFDVDISDNVPEIMVIDVLRLRQIFMNILSNAIKFTSEGYVCFRLWCESAEEKDFVKLVGEVEDSGCGISEEDQNRVFRPFRQVGANAAAERQGTGLGLSICHRLAILMGGEITLTSKLGEGSRFRFHIPKVLVLHASRDGAGEDGRDDRSEQVFKRLRASKIVIADDNGVNRELLAEMLEGEGHELLFASDGKEAVEITVAEKPDIVLMDVRMPVMDGRAARKALLERADTEHIPVIAVTASSMLTEEERFRQMFDGFICKPFKRSDVMGEVSRFLEEMPESSDRARSDGGAVGIEHPSDDPKRWPAMLEDLRALAAERLEEVRKVMAVSEVKEFSTKVEAIGREGRCRALVEYGRSLSDYTNTFRLSAIDDLLARFEQLVARIEGEACFEENAEVLAMNPTTVD